MDECPCLGPHGHVIINEKNREKKKVDKKLNVAPPESEGPGY